jgi:hypothetical protein
VHELRTNQKVLTGRVRSLRFIKGVRDLQNQTFPVKCEAKKCGRENVPVEEQAILSSCGRIFFLSFLFISILYFKHNRINWILIVMRYWMPEMRFA